MRNHKGLIQFVVFGGCVRRFSAAYFFVGLIGCGESPSDIRGHHDLSFEWEFLDGSMVIL